MRDPTRINRILNKLRVLWHLMPDLRLGQLIVNTAGALHSYELDGHDLHTCTDPFYVEDDKIEAAIDKAIADFTKNA